MTHPLAKLVAEAIENRQTLAFSYQGLNRVVQPSAVGLGWKGEAKLRGYQVAGRASRGLPDPDNPKLWDLGKITDLVVESHTFRPNQDYRKGDVALSVIWAEL